jgi:hypothetical protein
MSSCFAIFELENATASASLRHVVLSDDLYHADARGQGEGPVVEIIDRRGKVLFSTRLHLHAALDLEAVQSQNASGHHHHHGTWAHPKMRSGFERLSLPWGHFSHAVRIGNSSNVHIPKRSEVFAPALLAQGHTLHEVKITGPYSKRTNIVFLADGYTEEELPKFARDVDVALQAMEKKAPFGDYSQFYNVWRIDTASQDSGATKPCGCPDCPQPCTPVSRRTAFGCAFGGPDALWVRRCITCNDEDVLTTVNALVPQATGILVMVNDDEYGGCASANVAAQSNSDDATFPEVVIHELGERAVGESTVGESTVGVKWQCKV